ncbi:manganese efflux pump [Desulfothermobacter acidiphilus]|uniref:manganese efflux pump n=1 Tax=Desulfothermobacter acidiphilus TaxID=1938353 RepID=UPI003F8A69D9
MEWLLLAGLVLSASLDNFGVGISYGVRRVRVGLPANSIIAAVAFIFSVVGMTVGQTLARLFPGRWADVLAALILGLIGLRVALVAWPRKRRELASDSPPSSPWAILFRPEAADLNASGSIDWWEAVILGIALSANALVCSVSAGLVGFSPWLVASFMGVGSFASVWSGSNLGFRLARVQIGSFSVGQFGTFLSGFILLALALKVIFM